MLYGTKIGIFCDFDKESSNFYDKYFCSCKLIANFEDKMRANGSLNKELNTL